MKTFGQILNKIPEGKDLRQGVPDHEPTLDDFRKQVAKRVASLKEVSVSGLFDLIPEEERKGISTILLSGRASQLPELRRAVNEKAKELGAVVKSLNHPYHLKLAVAYGCALIRGDEFAGNCLPSGTLGRQLRVDGARNDTIGFSSDLPVSGLAPTLWQIRCPRPPAGSGAISYLLWERRTAPAWPSPDPDQPDNPETPLEPEPEDLIWTGCIRAGVSLPVGAGPGAFETFLVAWHPATDSYYWTDAGPDEVTQVWKSSTAQRVNLNAENFITGFPIGFPHDSPNEAAR
jgi:hypothetical protein